MEGICVLHTPFPFHGFILGRNICTKFLHKHRLLIHPIVVLNVDLKKKKKEEKIVCYYKSWRCLSIYFLCFTNVTSQSNNFR